MQRTDQQRKALEVFCKLLADTLNEAGLDQRKVLKPSIAIPWTQEAVKEQLWRPIQVALYNKRSTTELTKQELDPVHETLMRHLGQTFHIEHIPFPSHEDTFIEGLGTTRKEWDSAAGVG